METVTPYLGRPIDGGGQGGSVALGLRTKRPMKEHILYYKSYILWRFMVGGPTRKLLVLSPSKSVDGPVLGWLIPCAYDATEHLEISLYLNCHQLNEILGMSY